MNKTDQELAQIIWNYMRSEGPLERAGLILGLGSTDVRTAQWGAKLYHDGWAPKLLFTGKYSSSRSVSPHGDLTEAEAFSKICTEQGVPLEDILIENEATNTGENIRFSYEVLKNLNLIPGKIILISKPYMLRRGYATFMKQWPGEVKPKIICSAINQTFDEYCDDPYYTFEYVTNVMLGDLQRIKEYPKLGFQIEQDIPNDVWAAYELLVARGYTEHALS